MSSTQQALSNPRVAPAAGIRTEPCPNCVLCGCSGARLYLGLQDKLWWVSGAWNLKQCRNRSCGHLWLDPTPTTEDIAKAYETYYTHSDLPALAVADTGARRFIRRVKNSYLALRYGYRANEKKNATDLLGLLAYLTPFRRSLLDFSVMYLPYSPGGRLLEIGSGSGRMLKNMEDFGWQVEGIDFDAAAVCNSRSKGLIVHVGRLEDRRYPNNSFDAITMSHLIEHVPDPVSLIAECHRILKPSGALVVVTPNSESLGHRIYKRNWRGLEPPRHLHIFSLQSLAALVQMAGFRTIRAKTSVRDASGYLTASQSLQRNGSYQPDGRHSHSARALQIVEWMFIGVGFHLGEELALIARKCEKQ